MEPSEAHCVSLTAVRRLLFVICFVVFSASAARGADPADVARTCVFLAGTPSVTGTTLCVDNGQHLVPLPRDIMFVVEDLLHPPPASPTSCGSDTPSRGRTQQPGEAGSAGTLD